MTRTEQRLNSNHGRLVHAARAAPARLRDVPMPGWGGWTPRDMLAHVLARQEEALRHLREPDAPWPARSEIDAWNAAALGALRHLAWDEVLARLEANHIGLRARLGEDPPRWFGACTYWHYTEHTRALLAFLRSLEPSSAGHTPARVSGSPADSWPQSSTTTAAPIAAQS